MSDGRVITEHATCLGCGCACDDIGVAVEGGRIVEARNACSLGRAWFGDGRVPDRVMVAGLDVEDEDALDTAARALVAARRPLVYLAPDLSCEAQAAAVAIADSLGAGLDSVTAATAGGSVLASQERGRAGATLGEIRNRADVILFWGVDPAVRYPRFEERYAPRPVGVYLPEGRRSRMVIAVDVGDARGPADADRRVAVGDADEVATLIALGALVGEAPASEGAGTAWDRARELAAPLRAAKYAAIVADAEPGDGGPRDSGRAGALIALAQRLADTTRGALVTLRAGGNRNGADAVMTWQTGFPMAVDFARGAPRYVPLRNDAATRADVALVVGDAGLIPANVLEALAEVRCVSVGPRASEGVLASGENIVVDTGVAGIHEGGAALRMDDVALPLRPSLGGVRSAATTVRSLGQRVAALRAHAEAAR